METECVTYLGNRCGKYHDFIKLTHPLHELINAGPLDHVDIVIVSFNFYGYREVGLV